MINIDGIYVFICWSIVAKIRWLILTMNTMKRICGPLGPGLEYWSIPVWPCHMSSSVVLDHEIIAVWMKFRYLKERQARGTLFCGYAFESLSAGQAVCRHEQDPFFLIFFYREGHLFLAHFVGRCAAVAFSCCFSWQLTMRLCGNVYMRNKHGPWNIWRFKRGIWALWL